MELLNDWPDHAALRLVPAHPAFPRTEGAALVSAIDKLMDQFVREGRCRSGRALMIADGAVLAVVWEGPALSGCSHDKLNGVLAHHERDGRKLLTAPPIVLLDPPACVDRLTLRQLVAEQRAGAATPLLDLAVATVGEWRSRGRTVLAEHPIGRMVLRHAGG